MRNRRVLILPVRSMHTDNFQGSYPDLVLSWHWAPRAIIRVVVYSHIRLQGLLSQASSG